MVIISTLIMSSARLKSQLLTPKIQLSLHMQNSRLKISKKQFGLSTFGYKPCGALGALKELSWALATAAGVTQRGGNERCWSGVWSCLRLQNLAFRSTDPNPPFRAAAGIEVPHVLFFKKKKGLYVIKNTINHRDSWVFLLNSPWNGAVVATGRLHSQ